MIQEGKINIISSSNRSDNKTKVFAEIYAKLLDEQGIASEVWNMEQLPDDAFKSDIYDFTSSGMEEIVDKYLRPVDKLIFVLPEYNGSFPGILKLFIDAIRPREFHGKKAALLGISSGRSGNVRGMDHLAAILNYIRVEVYHHKLPIASIDEVLVENQIIDQEVLQRMQRQIKGFSEF